MTHLFSILASTEESSGGSIFSFLLLPLMLVAMYFLLIRPNSKRRKEASALQSALEVGDEVVTSSGIIGTITGEDGPTRFWLEIDDDVQVRIARGGIQGKIDIDDEEPGGDTEDDVIDVGEDAIGESDGVADTRNPADGD